MKKIVAALIKNRWDKVETTDTSSGKSSQNNYDTSSVLPTVTEELSRQEDIRATSAAQECASLPGFHELQMFIPNSVTACSWMQIKSPAGHSESPETHLPQHWWQFLPWAAPPTPGMIPLCPVHLSHIYLMPVASFLWKERHQKETGRYIQAMQNCKNAQLQKCTISQDQSLLSTCLCSSWLSLNHYLGLQP